MPFRIGGTRGIVQAAAHRHPWRRRLRPPCLEPPLTAIPGGGGFGLLALSRGLRSPKARGPAPPVSRRRSRISPKNPEWPSWKAQPRWVRQPAAQGVAPGLSRKPGVLQRGRSGLDAAGGPPEAADAEHEARGVGEGVLVGSPRADALPEAGDRVSAGQAQQPPFGLPEDPGAARGQLLRLPVLPKVETPFGRSLHRLAPAARLPGARPGVNEING